MASALPLFVVSFLFGLAAAADFSGGMKFVILAVAVVAKFAEMAVVPLSRFQAGNENERMVGKFSEILALTGATGVALSIIMAALNPVLLEWWTHGVLHWGWRENLGLSVWLVVVSCFRSVFSFAYARKQVRLVRLCPVAETIVFLLLLAVLRLCWGRDAVPWAMAGGALVAGFLFAARFLRHQGLPLGMLLSAWRKPVAVGAVALILLGWGMPRLATFGNQRFADVATVGVIAVLAGAVAGWISLPGFLRSQLRHLLVSLGHKVVPNTRT